MNRPDPGTIDRSEIAEMVLFLCGDVMTGRGIDQILPHPGKPNLYESYIRDARQYVELAEDASGPIPAPVDFDYIWGDALEELDRAGTDARIVNLETAVTASDIRCLGKRVLYRMHPSNIGCIKAARIDCCCLANNHLLDWGYEGLSETLRTLDAAGMARTGAGETAEEAGSPAVLDLREKGRILVSSVGSTTSGIPEMWAATEKRAGVDLLADLSAIAASRIAGRVREISRPRDVSIVSIHWGGNWGYDIPPEQTTFAHRLIDEGVDIVHGHSSHHAKSIEVYRDRLILYGCGDFLTDYEGITGHERFRSDLAVMYLVKFDAAQNRLVELKMIPFQSRRLRLKRAAASDAAWLCDLMNRLGRPFRAGARLETDGSISLQ